MATVVELTALLVQAQTARHSLLTGRGIASVRDQNGEETRYTQTDTSKLGAYIDELQDQIDALNATGCPPATGPMRLMF